MVSHSPVRSADPSRPPEPCDVDWAEDLDMDEWKLSARRGDELVGECEAWGVPDHLKELPGAGEWVTVEFIEVEKPFRRRGWGRWLLREQLRRQAKLGKGRAILWTESGNRPMLGLLASLGFELGPECVCMVREL
ncbi:MAG: GNAT family N-acetyltransferase [Planctomycetota bacterium]